MPPKSPKSPAAGGKKKANKKKGVDDDKTGQPAEVEKVSPKYCGFKLTDCDLQCIDPVGTDEFEFRCEPQVDVPDFLTWPNYYPDTAAQDESHFRPFTHPCIESWQLAKSEAAAAATAEQAAENELQATPEVTAADQPASKVGAANSSSPKAKKRDDKRKGPAEDLMTQPTQPPAAKLPTFCRHPKKCGEDVCEMCVGCVPDKEILEQMYHFTDEQLNELEEAFLYFGSYIDPAEELKTQTASHSLNDAQDGGKSKRGRSPKADKKSKGKAAEKPAADKSDAKGVKGKKGKKDGKSSPVRNEPDEAAAAGDAAAAAAAAKEALGKPGFGLNSCSFARCLRSIGQNPSEFDLALMLRMAGPEPIDMTSYLYAVDCWKLRSKCEMEDDLWHAFKVFDRHGYCRISICELKQALECFGEPLDEPDLNELLCLAGPADRDGMIDIASFVHRLIKIPSRRATCPAVKSKAPEVAEPEVIPDTIKSSKKAKGKAGKKK